MVHHEVLRERACVRFAGVRPPVVMDPAAVAADAMALAHEIPHETLRGRVVGEVDAVAIAEGRFVGAGRDHERERAVVPHAEVLQLECWLDLVAGAEVPVEHQPGHRLRQRRQRRQVQHLRAEIVQVPVDQHAVGLAVEVGERQVDEQHAAVAVRVVAGYQPERRRGQDRRAGVRALRDEARIGEEAVHVAGDAFERVGGRRRGRRERGGRRAGRRADERVGAIGAGLHELAVRNAGQLRGRLVQYAAACGRRVVLEPRTVVVVGEAARVRRAGGQIERAAGRLLRRIVRLRVVRARRGHDAGGRRGRRGRGPRHRLAGRHLERAKPAAHAGYVAETDHVAAQLVIQYVVHTDHVAETGFGAHVEAGRIQHAEIVDEHHLAAVQRIVLDRRDERVVGRRMHLIGQDQAGILRQRRAGRHELAVGHHRDLQPFLLRGVQPCGHARIGQCQRIRHQQDELVGGRLNPARTECEREREQREQDPQELA